MIQKIQVSGTKTVLGQPFTQTDAEAITGTPMTITPTPAGGQMCWNESAPSFNKEATVTAHVRDLQVKGDAVFLTGSDKFTI